MYSSNEKESIKKQGYISNKENYDLDKHFEEAGIEFKKLYGREFFDCNVLEDLEGNRMTFEELKEKVEKWSKDRKIIPNSTPETQLFKAFSEMGELADAAIKYDLDEIKDAVGDVLVCLINYCYLQDICITECLYWAYDEIKDRKGTLLPNGVFVKE